MSFDPLQTHARLVRLSRCLIGAIAACNAALLLLFIASGYRAFLNSDAAAKSLLAQEMLVSGRAFPPEWNYVNGDLMVLFGQWFVLPLLPVLGNGYPAYAVSSLVSTVLILLATWLAARLVLPGRWPRVAVLAIFASGFSEISADSLFGQVSYGNVYFLACFMLALAWRAIVSVGRVRLAATLALGALALGVAWGNPERAAASQVLPLCAAFALHVLMAQDRGRAWRAAVWPSSALIAGLAVGTGLHAATLAHVQNKLGAAHALWLDFDGMRANAFHAVHGVMAMLGCLPQPGDSVVSPTGAWNAIRLVAGSAAVALVPVAIAWSVRAARPASVRFFGAFTLASFALVFMLHVTTTIPDMADPVSSARYLLPPLLCTLVLVVGMVVDTAVSPAWRAVAGGVSLVLAMSAINSPMGAPLRPAEADTRLALLARLDRDGLRDGYASYWNAGALTVLSGDRVRVRQIVSARGLPLPMRHLSSERWYRPGPSGQPTFFLFTPEESAAIDWPAMQRFLGAPIHRFAAHGMDVVVYSRHPADVLPGWNADFSRPMTLFASSTSSHAIGRYDAKLQALVAEAGQSGPLHFGPYVPLPPGSYEATFLVSCHVQTAETCGTVDVATDIGAVVFAKAPIPANGTRPVRVRFDVPRRAGSGELRVFSDGRGRVALRAITLRKVSAR